MPNYYPLRNKKIYLMLGLAFLSQSTLANAAGDEEANVDASTLHEDAQRVRSLDSESALRQRRLKRDLITDAGNHASLELADDSEKIKIFGLLQHRWVGNFRSDEDGRTSSTPDADSVSGFEFRRVEIGLSGSLGIPELNYTVVMAYDGGVIIAQDIVASYELNDNWSIATGRYFAPFLREELIGGGGSLAVGLSEMNNNLSMARGEGLSLKYDSETFRGHVFFSDGKGSGGGDLTLPAADYAATFRGDLKVKGDWSQWGNFTAGRDDDTAIFLGAAIHMQGGESGGMVGTEDLFAWTVDGSFESSGFNLFFSVAGNHTDVNTGLDIDNYGAVVQLGYMAVPDKIEVFGRYEHLSFDSDLGYVEDDVTMLTLGANYHINSHAKIAFDTIYALDPIPNDSPGAGLLADGVEDGQIVARLQFQLAF